MDVYIDVSTDKQITLHYWYDYALLLLLLVLGPCSCLCVILIVSVLAFYVNVRACKLCPTSLLCIVSMPEYPCYVNVCDGVVCQCQCL